MRKGLSNVVATMILITLLLTVSVPLIIYSSYYYSYSTAYREVANNYLYLKSLQVAQVTTGHPGFYYNGSAIYVAYGNGTFVPQSNVTITSILYLDSNGVWVNVTTLKYPITLRPNQVLALPSYATNRPVIVVTSIGNIFFLAPNTSVGPLSLLFSGKGGVVIITQIFASNGSILLVHTNVTTNIMGNMQNYTTPAAFPNTTGTFVAKVPQYVYYENSKGQVITGVFRNWAVVGSAWVNSTTTQGIQVTLQGSYVLLIASYTQLNAYVTVTLKTNYPGTVQVMVDGNTYSFNNTKTIQVPAGYARITVLTLQGNFTSQQSQGVIKHYTFSNMTVQVGTTTSTYKNYTVLTFFPVNSQPVVSINYVNDYSYYRVGLVAYYNYYNNPVAIGNQLYNYGTTVWIIGGNYTFGPVGTFIQVDNNRGYTFGALQVVFQYANGTSFTYNFPNIPTYVIINQPMNITVYYGLEMVYYRLPGA